MRPTVCRSTLVLALASVAAAGCASGFRDDFDGGRPRDGGGRDGGPVDVGMPRDVNDDTNKPDAGTDAAFDSGPVCVDGDHDGFGMGCTSGPDCDDTDANVSPNGTEVCNGVNDDCDASTDEGLDTPVFCGMGACRTSVPQCSGGTTSVCTPLPMGTETCNGIDDNCDGQTDEGFGGTSCGIGACRVTVAACMGGSPPPCVPGMPSAETCNGVDDDCNTAVDDGIPMISCGTGQCRRSVPGCSAGVPGTCVPGMPTNESCNGLDDNCDGVVDDGFGSISCGQGECARTVGSCTMGMPMSCTPGTPTAETCNNRDDDCNGMVDDGFATLTCGVGACLRTAPGCVSGVPGTCTPGMPAGSESCGNGMDDNCNGSIDEGCMTCTPPGNTACSSATAYTVGATVMGDNTCAGNDVSGASCGSSGAGNDTAYSFTSSGSPTRYTFTMTGSDTVLHGHASSACSATDALACNAGGGTSQITIDSPPAGTIYLVTDGTGASPGPFTLTSSSSALNHDTCSSPIRITANGTYTGNTATAGDQYTPSCDTSLFGNLSNDVVYSLTARSSGSVTASLCGSGFDTILFVGTSCGSSNVGCNDDSCGLQSSVTFATTAGTTYYIIIDGYGSGQQGAYTMSISGY